MATAIFFNGRRINRPGAYTEVDASALASLGPGATGIVALIGTAVGGKPLDVSAAEADHTRDGTLLKKYKSGDLRVAGQFAFSPSKDPTNPGGAQKIVCIKVNPSTQSEVTLDDADGNDAMRVYSIDYGLDTTQINIAVAAGTTIGKKLTVVYEDNTETFDDVGGEGIFSLQYTAGSNGYDACTLQVSATQTAVIGTKAIAGLETERAAEMSSTQAVEVLSSAAGDTTQTATIYGIDGSGVPCKASIALNGTTVVEGTQLFAQVTGAKLSGVTVGNITVRTADGITTLFSFTAGQTTKGLAVLTNAFFMGAGSIAVDATTAGSNVVVRGLTAAGAEVAVRLDAGAGLTQSLTSAMGMVASIMHVELADLPAARTATLTSTVTLAHASFGTPRKQVDRLNALSGLAATAIVPNPTTFTMSDCDYEAAASILGTAVTIYADLFYCIDTLNDESAYVNAERATGGAKPPAVTSAVFLTGGEEGTPTITEWSQAFALLRKRRVNIVVPLTNDPAVHALLFSHLVERAGRLRSEANGYVGIGTDDGEGETATQIKSQIRALNTRHITALSEEVSRFDPDTAEATWYPPYIYAAIAAGMQAGMTVGEPLTKKMPNVLDVRRDSTWTVEDNAEEMIDAGLLFTVVDDEKGISFERGVTTHLADDNPVFVETSANAAMNYALYEFRRRLELKVGQKGVGGSAAAIKGLAAGVLAELVDDEIIVAWQGLQVEQIADSFPVAVEMSPVLPINFIPITVHVTAVRIAA